MSMPDLPNIPRNMKDFRPLNEIITKTSFCEDKTANMFSDCCDLLIRESPNSQEELKNMSEADLDRVMHIMASKMDTLNESDRVNFYVLCEMMAKLTKCITISCVNSMVDHHDKVLPKIMAIKLSELEEAAKERDKTFSGGAATPGFFSPGDINPHLN